MAKSHKESLIFFKATRCYHDRAIQCDGDDIVMTFGNYVEYFFLPTIRGKSHGARVLLARRATTRSPHEMICALCVGSVASPANAFTGTDTHGAIRVHARMGWIT